MNFDNATMVIMQGASGSGKSVFAQKIASTNSDWRIVSRDEIRKQIMGEELLERYFDEGLDWSIEELVTTIEQEDIARVLGSGKRVIIDNTNLRLKYVAEYVKIAHEFGIPLEKIAIVHIPVDFETACLRVEQRGNRTVRPSVIASQIASSNGIRWDTSDCFESIRAKGRKLKTWFVPPFEVEKYTPDPSLPSAVICDLDGTLALRKLEVEPYVHIRSFFDYDAAVNDNCSPFVLEVIKALSERHQIIFVSGRKEEGRKATETFLENAGIKDYILFMRDPSVDQHEGKDDSDDIVKYRIFNESIRHNYNVLGVIDDRKRVLALWEALEVSTLNAGKLNEVF